jgi:hypothetical protein
LVDELAQQAQTDISGQVVAAQESRSSDSIVASISPQDA